ncbi:hypothetical protein Peur_069345 [Populus x canadensis]
MRMRIREILKYTKTHYSSTIAMPSVQRLLLIRSHSSDAPFQHKSPRSITTTRTEQGGKCPNIDSMRSS